MENALRGGLCTPEQHEMLASQLDEIQRLSRIVDGLTLLAKADAGLVSVARSPVPLHELVQDNFTDAQLLAKPTGITVQLLVCDEVTLEGDRDRLRQLLLNLMDNAIKHNRRGGIVTIALRDAGRDAELEVCNTGPGIPPELLPRVFDRFFRVDPRQTEGCGLGLSISQWIVKAHGGTITIHSQRDGLTTVSVRLPFS